MTLSWALTDRPRFTSGPPIPTIPKGEVAITPETVLEFDFSSSDMGNWNFFHFDTDQEWVCAQDYPHSFFLYGTEERATFFRNTHRMNMDYKDLYATVAPNVKRYTIPIGQHYTGTFRYLGISSGEASSATYSNIKLSVPPPPQNPVLSVPAPEPVRFPDRHIPLLAEVTDDDPDPVVFLWEQVEGPYPAQLIGADTAAATAVVEQPGLYRFRVTATRGEWPTMREVEAWAYANRSRSIVLTADSATFVRDGTYANDAYGAVDLMVKQSVTSFSRQAFVRFALPDLDAPILMATLSMTPISTGMAGMDHVVHGVAATGWEEATLTWNTRPAIIGSALGQVPINANQVWSLDISDAVNAAEGQVAVRLATTMDFGAYGHTSYAGRTHADELARPRLELRYDSGVLSYDDWMDGSPHIPPERRDPFSDASGDGQANLLAYLSGLEPDEPAEAPFLSLVERDGSLVARWRQDMRATAIPYRLEWTPRLDPADWRAVTGAYRFADEQEQGDIRLLETEIGFEGLSGYIRYSAN